LWGWFALVLTLALLLILGGVIFLKSGHWLVRSDPFEKVTWAVVLAGESRDCERTDAALELYREGRIDSLMLSACRIYKTHYESEFTVKDMISAGYPKGKIFEFHQDAYSTLEEARLLIRQFRFQNLDTVLIITSNYHSARTRRIFKKLAQGYPHILVYSADFKTYNPEVWWSGRESRKYWIYEWMRTTYSWFELARALPENGTADFQNLLPDIWSGKAVENKVDSQSILSDTTERDILSTIPVDSLVSLPVSPESSQVTSLEKELAKPSEGKAVLGPAQDTVAKVQVKVPEKRPFPKAEPAVKKKPIEKAKKKSLAP
jgi:uncharacterized SAM-binding protein YcdF (DUF218 family)